MKSVDVDLPVERVYRSLLSYLENQPDLNVTRYQDHSLVETDAEIISRLPPRHASRKTSFEIFPRNGSSLVKLSFDFSDYLRKELLGLGLVWVLGILIAVALNSFELLASAMAFGFLTLIFGFWTLETTKKKFTERFTGFLRGLEYTTQDFAVESIKT